MPKKRTLKKESSWFKAPKTSSEMGRVYAKFGKNVDKPHAIREKAIKGKMFEQVYHKPLSPGENWD
jgi:hypothetical protein